ncbi:MAG: mechanosensitive ion channel family protein [Spirochaetes bacterium]|nr:mechanosensitive ion channel family protein [Spirochaetota bacterium]
MGDFFNPQHLKVLWAEITRGNVIIATAIVLAFTLAVRFMILRIAFRNIDDRFVRLRYKRALSYIVFFVALLFLLPIWLPSIRNVATFLGIFGAGFLVVTREIWISVAGWAYIMIRRPYVIGDRVQIKEIVGDVIDIRLMETSVMEVKDADSDRATGRIVYVPNARLFGEILVTSHLKSPLVFHYIEVQLTPDSDWEKAAELLKTIAATEYKEALAAKTKNAIPGTVVNPPLGYREPRVLVEAKPGCVSLELEFMAPTGYAAVMIDAIWRAFLKAARENGNIKIA